MYTGSHTLCKCLLRCDKFRDYGEHLTFLSSSCVDGFNKKNLNVRCTTSHFSSKLTQVAAMAVCNISIVCPAGN